MKQNFLPAPISCSCTFTMVSMFFFASRLPQNYGEVMATDKERFNRFFHAMLDGGVYFAPALYEAGFVSSAHGDAEFEHTLAAARTAFALLGA